MAAIITPVPSNSVIDSKRGAVYLLRVRTSGVGLAWHMSYTMAEE